MSVYYIHSPENNLIKIGFAQHPVSRLGKMRVDSPLRLILLACEVGGKSLEKRRHNEFAELHHHGEWFRFDGSLAAHVAKLPVYIIEKKRVALNGALGAWIIKNDHTLQSFSDLTDTTETTISRLCDGKQFPRRDLMIRIIEATNWEVDANMLFGIEPKSQQAAA